jgi:hypothetical protein
MGYSEASWISDRWPVPEERELCREILHMGYSEASLISDRWPVPEERELCRDIAYGVL